MAELTITINIKGEDVVLTVDEARALMEELKSSLPYKKKTAASKKGKGEK